jgi:hypothetical protein
MRKKNQNVQVDLVANGDQLDVVVAQQGAIGFIYNVEGQFVAKFGQQPVGTFKTQDEALEAIIATYNLYQ